MTARRTLMCGSALAAAVFTLSCTPPASADDVPLTALEDLGKHFFFDDRLSTPRNKQACASCHNPAVGWTLPLSEINETTVGAPGAQPGLAGGRKPQNNSYVAGEAPPFGPDPGQPSGFSGGAFWDGRAEGCGMDEGNDATCRIGEFAVSETITWDDLPEGSPHVVHLGPAADQALNPTARPGVEQNTREKTVCQLVKTGPYVHLYKEAWGEAIKCKSTPKKNPAYRQSFKKLAVAVSAWQASPDVNSFSSPRDHCISGPPYDADGVFPCDNLSAAANLGHDIFYGRNDSGENRIVANPLPFGPPERPLSANCAFCHNNGGFGSDGNEAGQLYTDHGYHNIALPYNREIPNSVPGGDTGLSAHKDLSLTFPEGGHGHYKTPTLRNAAKDELGITKSFMHNGYLKTLKDVVHFYNTRSVKQACEDLGIEWATAAEALAANCWPVAEQDEGAPVPFLLGNLGLTSAEEDALVAYIESLADEYTPQAPSMIRNPNDS